MKIAEATVVHDMPEADYHAHEGSLSASGAKYLAPPHPCPAKFKHAQENPVEKAAFDVGHVTHELVLGKGQGFEVLAFDSWRTNEAKALAAAVRDAGRVPVLEADFELCETMAKAVLDDPLAGPLFTGPGDSEVSLFWPDAASGVVRRARLDRLRVGTEGRRTIIGDLKTARSSAPDEFGKAAANYGYAISAANYIDGAAACGLGDDAVFLFVAVEKEAPHVVTTYQAQDDDITLGRYLMAEALKTYAWCVEHDQWPGYASSVLPLSLPFWYTREFEDVGA